MLALSVLSVILLVGASHAQYDANCDGKQVIVHLFEWKWSDIALECERFLSQAGYCGVQVSPPNEHVILVPENQPWWQRYQPVSYLLHSRSGNEQEFADMVQRCNAVGVRVFVDAVINHMAGLGRKGTSYEGTTYDADILEFPGVPFDGIDFTPRELCPSADGNINNYDDPVEVRNCYLLGLTDLYQATEWVRDHIAGYLKHLVELGVAGLRIDAAKHMWPEDLADIFARIPELPTSHGFKAGSRLFIYQEVTDYGDGGVHVDEYYGNGLVTEFRYPLRLAGAIKDFSQFNNLVDDSIARPDRALIFVDNHDTQRYGTPDDVVTFKTPLEYQQATAYTLAQGYGFTKVMSSFAFDNIDQGPPSDGNFTALDVVINADGSCGNGWVCEHRWLSNSIMVQFRNAVAGTETNNYWNNGQAVAFSRGNLGFFAMVHKDGSLDESLQTGLPAGTYCNIVNNCQTQVTVESDGTARVQIGGDNGTILAVCVGCNN